MDCRDILNHIEQGSLADLTRDDLTAGAAAVLSVSAKTASVLAVVVARLRAMSPVWRDLQAGKRQYIL